MGNLYVFKFTPELLWTLAILLLVAVVNFAQGLTPEQMKEPMIWIPGLIVAIARPLLGFIMDKAGSRPS